MSALFWASLQLEAVAWGWYNLTGDTFSGGLLMAYGRSPKKDKIILLLREGLIDHVAIANSVGCTVAYVRLVKDEFL